MEGGRAPTRLLHPCTNTFDLVLNLEGEINVRDALMDRARRKYIDICSKVNMYSEDHAALYAYHC
jgi:hypothetical protein